MSDDVLPPLDAVPVPTASAGQASELRAFLIADIRGYTSFTQQFGDERAARLAARFAVATRSVVAAHDGGVLELRGDEALCVFPPAPGTARSRGPPAQARRRDAGRPRATPSRRDRDRHR